MANCFDSFDIGNRLLGSWWIDDADGAVTDCAIGFEPAVVKIIYVKWRDSAYRYTEEDVIKAGKREVVTFESTGFLLHESEDRIVICQDIDQFERARCSTAIPRENVLESKVVYEQ